MSDYNPGSAGPMYVPPPPGARRARSPWVWVGLGCGLLTLLLFGGCAALLIVGGREMQRISRSPRDAQAVRRSVEKYVPLYPNSDVNVPLSHQLHVASRVVGVILPNNRPEMGAFRAPASPEAVMAWYEKQMTGWKAADVPAQHFGDDSISITASRQFVREGTQVQIQVGPIVEQKERSNLIVIVISGLPH